MLVLGRADHRVPPHEVSFLIAPPKYGVNLRFRWPGGTDGKTVSREEHNYC